VGKYSLTVKGTLRTCFGRHVGTREDILGAAARIMRTEGYARATTKEIARAAGYSEAALYKHFQDKTEIFLRVLEEQLPELAELLARLEAGEGEVRANLEQVVATAVAFYADSFPIAVSLYSSRALLVAHRERVRELGGGPRMPEEVLARYLAAEQLLGRLAPSADPRAMARLLLGACFQQAFLADFAGAPLDAEQRAELARSLVATVLGATAGAG
jgi:AcrR family transcriptional regulator